MPRFTSAAPKLTDKSLYSNASPGLRRLMQRSRGELRQKGRVEFMAAQQPQSSSTGTSQLPNSNG